nr:MAG: hypothetical protein DIU78_01395 [Pseudomonadota bacterium]
MNRGEWHAPPHYPCARGAYNPEARVPLFGNVTGSVERGPRAHGCAATDLHLAGCQGVADEKSTMPVLGNVLLEIEGQGSIDAELAEGRRARSRPHSGHARATSHAGSGSKVATQRSRMPGPRPLSRSPTVVATAVLLAACGAATRNKPAETPPEDVKAHKDTDQRPSREENPPVVAPPPAYGNRIVDGSPSVPEPSASGASTAAASQRLPSATEKAQRLHEAPATRPNR